MTVGLQRTKMSDGINTYCDGPTLLFTQDVTKADYYHMCERLGAYPDSSCEGGFCFLDGPLGYKTLRHRMRGIPWSLIWCSKQWGAWKEDHETVVIPKGTIARTLCKALRNAAPWTLRELDNCVQILESLGVRCTDLPTERELQWTLEGQNKKRS